MFNANEFRDIDHAAKELAGNHRRFESFGWYDRPEDDEKWAIVYTHNRDSDLVDLSNAGVIDSKLSKYPDDAVSERHNHWACGWIDGYAIRVYDAKGEITPAFRACWELACAIAEYPVLDDSDHSEREYNAALENIESEGRRDVIDDAPEDWPGQVFSWLWDNDQGEVENRDGNGAYPSRESIRAALEALNLAAQED